MEGGFEYHFELCDALASVRGAEAGTLRPLCAALRVFDGGLRAATGDATATAAAASAAAAAACDAVTMARGGWLCIIMRGLPGSGKSTLTRKLLHAWAATYGTYTAQCSADSFFENGAGLSRRRLQELASAPGAPSSVYRLVFDRGKLGAAHAHCRGQFTDAIAYGCGLVLVDNTNTTLDEYAYYRRTAERAGYHVCVLEVLGARRYGGHLDVLHRRNTHGVPREVFDAMYKRWEADRHTRAVARLRPPGLGTPSPAPPPRAAVPADSRAAPSPTELPTPTSLMASASRTV